MNNKEILENAPEGATHAETLASSNIYYFKKDSEGRGYQVFISGNWVFMEVTGYIRSLADIKGIVELEARTQWISVEDRLPDEYQLVLCLYKDRGEVMQIVWEEPTFEETFEAFRYWIDFEERFTPDWEDITHWMPLPTPPVGGEL